MSDPVVDLSHWNTVTSFAALADAGVVGVIHKCTERDNYVDDTYASRRDEAERAGLLWGAYHFLRPGDMRKQAEWFVSHVGDPKGVLYAADHEDAGVSLDDLKEFLAAVAELTGVSPVVYSGHVIKDQVRGCDPELAQYRLWLAQYTSGSPSWPTQTWESWWLWQYTDQGHVNGVSGAVDCNRYVGESTDDLASEWAGESAPPFPAPEPEPEPVATTITITMQINVTAPPGAVIEVGNATMNTEPGKPTRWARPT